METGRMKLPDQEKGVKINEMQFSYDSSLVTREQIESLSEPLIPYIDVLQKVADGGRYDADESTINLPFDEQMLKEVKDLKEKKVTSKLKYILNISIGGSSLGTKAVYDARHGYYDTIQPRRFPKMIFAETNDPENLANLSKFVKEEINDPEELLINVTSKSGGTTETIANFEILQNELTQKFGNISERIVVITGLNSNFWRKAQAENIATLTLPDTTGGRYSVLSPVGLFPLLAAGIDVEALRAGARKQREVGLSKDLMQNHAALSAILLFQNYKNGFKINDNFIFSPALESLGKWYKQLMGESIGKDGKGITPTVSIGSTDLHSTGQIKLGGEKVEFTTFISYSNPTENPSVPSKMFLPGLVSNLENKTASDIMDAILSGTKKAFKDKSLPFTEIELPGQNEEAIGEFMQFKMMEMMYLGKLMGVNPFDQPNVEDYKTETKKILSGQV
jgi:glucose-6-phosphate isomerase